MGLFQRMVVSPSQQDAEEPHGNILWTDKEKIGLKCSSCGKFFPVDVFVEISDN